MKRLIYLALSLLFLFECINAQTGAGTGNIRLRDAMDIDGNDLADFSVFRPSDQNWYFYKNGCSSNCTSTETFGDPDVDVLTPGDYDGDGKGDVSVWRKTTGYWYRINSSNQNVVITSFGQANTDEPVARDYDGDGKTDLAIVRRENGQMTWWVSYSNGGSATVQWGLSTDFVAPGDYDGDGKFDYTIQRPGATPSTASSFYTLKSSNGGSEILNWGAGDDRAVPGDYDGDGKTDYAVVREWDTTSSNLVWNIRKSSNASQLQISYGLTCTNSSSACDANPAQNDYDGDGKTDLAVWRTDFNSANSSFYYLSSSSNFVTSTQVQWGLRTDYPVASYDSH